MSLLIYIGLGFLIRGIVRIMLPEEPKARRRWARNANIALVAIVLALIGWGVVRSAKYL